MSPALQRRFARLFPQGNETTWLDCRKVVLRCGSSFPVAIIGLDYMAASGNVCLPARTLVLDMDRGASMEDVIRSGADGILCSTFLPWDRLAALAQQCRKWNYSFIADCRKIRPQTIQTFFTLGAHAALLDTDQLHQTPFRYRITRLVSDDTLPVLF